LDSQNIAMLDSVIGKKGEMTKIVYKYTIGCPDVSLQEHGMPLNAFIGFNTWVVWQGTPEKPM